MKSCPYCGELVKNNAIRCKYCNEWLVDKKETNNKNKFFLVFSAICYILFILIMMIYLAGLNNINHEEIESTIFLFMLLFGLVYTIYFIPTIIAMHKKHSNTNTIFIINLVLGWTLFGWIISLILAICYE